MNPRCVVFVIALRLFQKNALVQLPDPTNSILLEAIEE
jgi:hypothetical protein